MRTLAFVLGILMTNITHAQQKKATYDFPGGETVELTQPHAENSCEEMGRRSIKATNLLPVSLDFCQKMQAQFPKSLRLTNATALLFDASGDFTKALDYRNRAVQIERTAETLSALGALHFEHDNMEQAKSYLDEALSLDKEDISTNKWLGHYYMKKKRNKKAKQHLRIACNNGTKTYGADVAKYFGCMELEILEGRHSANTKE